MPEADNQPSTPASPTPPPLTIADLPTRRGLFSGLGRAALGTALVVASAPPEPFGPDHPDAEFLGVLSQFREVEEAIFPAAGAGCRTIAEEDAWEVRTAPLRAALDTLAERVCDLRATTPDGWQARARALLLPYPDLPTDAGSGLCVGDRLLHALIRDLLAETVT